MSKFALRTLHYWPIFVDVECIIKKKKPVDTGIFFEVLNHSTVFVLNIPIIIISLAQLCIFGFRSSIGLFKTDNV